MCGIAQSVLPRFNLVLVAIDVLCHRFCLHRRYCKTNVFILKSEIIYRSLLLLKWDMTSKRTLIWIIIRINLLFACAFLNAVFFLNFFFRKLLSVRKSFDVFELEQNVVAQLKILRVFFKRNKVKSRHSWLFDKKIKANWQW